MTLTVADASRSYRQRRAEKMARMEAALEEIQKLEARDVHEGYDQTGGYIWEQYIRLADVRDIARQALNPGKEMGE